MADVITDYARHLRRRRLSAGTVQRRVGHLRLLELNCGPLLELDGPTLEAFIDARRGRYGGELGDSARAGWVTCVQGFYAWALERGLVDDDPSALLVGPTVSRGLPRPIDEREYQAAIDAADRTMRSWLLLGGYAGLRCMEIAGLVGENVAHDDGTLRVLGKGAKWRVVPMHRRVMAALEGAPRRGPVFRRPDGRAFYPHQVSQLGAAHLRACGSTATMHQLRHRFATRLLEVSGDLALVAEVLGHARMDTTRVYALVTGARRRDAVLSID